MTNRDGSGEQGVWENENEDQVSLPELFSIVAAEVLGHVRVRRGRV